MQICLKSEAKVFSFVVLYQACTAVLVVGISALSFSSVSEIHFGSDEVIHSAVAEILTFRNPLVAFTVCQSVL